MEMESKIFEAFLQAGIPGAVLAWVLYQNSRLVQKIISVCEETNKVLADLAGEIRRIK